MKIKRESGEPRVQASVWLRLALVKRLKMLAVQRRTTLTAVVSEACEAYLSSRRSAA